MYTYIELNEDFLLGQTYECEKHTVMIRFPNGQTFLLSPSGRLEKIQNINYNGEITKTELLYDSSQPKEILEEE